MLGRSFRRRSNIPALGSKLHKRSETLSHFTKLLRAMRLWGGNRHTVPVSFFYIARKTRGTGQAGSCDRPRTRCVDRGDFSKASRYRTSTEVVTQLLSQCPLWVKSGLMQCKKPCPLRANRSRIVATK